MSKYDNRPAPPAISEDYKIALQRGYFDEKGALRQEFIRRFSKEVAQSFQTGSMTSTQLRNFYNHVKTASSVYRLKKATDGAEAILLDKILKLDAIVKYNISREGISIPPTFETFVSLNLDACHTAKDIIDGFAPHFETIVGYFKYFEKTRRRR